MITSFNLNIFIYTSTINYLKLKTYISLFTFLVSGIFLFIILNKELSEKGNDLQTSPREELYFNKFGHRDNYIGIDESSEGIVFNKRVNFKPGTSEPVIVNNKNNIYIFSNDFNNKGIVTGFFSENFGKSFYANNLKLTNEFHTYADPDAATDNNENIYFTAVQRDNKNFSSIVLIIKSGGSQSNYLIDSNINGKIKFDKPKILILNNKIYITYIKKEDEKKHLFLFSSKLDLTEKEYKLISSVSPNSASMKNHNQDLYISYSNDKEINLLIYDSNNNNLKNFKICEFESPGKKIKGQNTIKSSGNFGVRVNSSPSMLISNMNNKIFITFCGKNGDDNSDIFITHSDLSDLNFSVPVKISCDKSLNDQFHPVISEDELGNIYISYQDSRDDEKNILVNTYLSYSIDKGITFSDLKLSTKSFNPYNIVVGGNYIGDYNTQIVTSDKLISVWTDGRKNNFDLYMGIINLKKLIN